MDSMPKMLSAAVEGILDEAVVRRLAEDLGVPINTVHICGGKLKLIEFTQRRWRPTVASKHSDSLRRCREALRRITTAFRP